MRTSFRLSVFLLLGCLTALPLYAADPEPEPAAPPPAAAEPAEPAGPVAIDSWLDEKGALWTFKADAFMKEHEAHGFTWATDGKTIAESGSVPLTFAGLNVPAVTAHFTSGILKLLTLHFFDQARGDYLTLAEYEKLLGDLNRQASAWAGNPGAPRKVDLEMRGVTIRAKGWVKPPHQIELRWGFSPKTATGPRPEFVRVRLTRGVAAQETAGGAGAVAPQNLPRPPQTVAELRVRVKRDPRSRDVLIKGVPLVDQGRFGYCAAAVATRLFHYFGRPAIMTKLTEIPQADMITGSPPELLATALRVIAKDSKFVVTKVLEFDNRDYGKMVKDYNRLTKRIKDRPKEDTELTWHENSSALDFFSRAKNDRLIAVRNRQFAEIDAFKLSVKRTIDGGAPLAWIVVLGVVKETPAPPGRGGHVRLIVGYNSRTDEVLLSDNFGEAHALKRMPFAEAWPMTVGLYIFHPPNLRF